MHRMATSLLLYLAMGVSHLAGQTDRASGGLVPVPGSELRVWLVTVGAGEAVWERFGHNALRVLDTSTGEDVAYNWGIFDFNQVDFIPRFLKGQMLYRMAPFRAGPMVEAYSRTGRRIVTQELGLAPAQRLALRDLAERNALPENREYLYNYFLDNCSTRVRDLLDQVLGGALAHRFAAAPTGTSFRYHVRRLTRSDPFLYTGMDVLLGTPGDRPISVWEEMFLPMTLRDAIRDVTVLGEDGVERPLVIAEDVVVPGSGRPTPKHPHPGSPLTCSWGSSSGAPRPGPARSRPGAPGGDGAYLPPSGRSGVWWQAWWAPSSSWSCSRTMNSWPGTQTSSCRPLSRWGWSCWFPWRYGAPGLGLPPKGWR